MAAPLHVMIATIVLAVGYATTEQADASFATREEFVPGTDMSQPPLHHHRTRPSELDQFADATPPEQPPPEQPEAEGQDPPADREKEQSNFKKDPILPIHDSHPDQPRVGFITALDVMGRKVRIDKATQTIPTEYILTQTHSRSKAYAAQPEMCDACKTMVEELHRRLHKMAIKVSEHSMDGPMYHRNFSKASLHAVDTLCNSSKFKQFAPHIQAGCHYMLQGDKRREVLATFDRVHPIHVEHGTHANGTGYVPKHCVWRRRMICEDVFGVCPEQPPPQALTDCRVCAEVFRDLHYMHRRDHPEPSRVSPGYPTALAQRRKRLHGHVMDLCADVHMRHSFGVAPHLSEQCLYIVGKHMDQIMDVYARADSYADPAEYLCVNVTSSCSNKAFRLNSDHCEHEHDFTRRADALERHMRGEEL